MSSFYHATLNTGHGRWSPRSEVSDQAVQALGWHVVASIREPSPIPTMPGYLLEGHRAGAGDGGFYGTVWSPEHVPFCTLAVTPDPDEVPEIWRGLPEAAPKLPKVDQEGPWLLVLLQPTNVLFGPEIHLAMGDYERCVAWAWLERPRPSKR